MPFDASAPGPVRRARGVSFKRVDDLLRESRIVEANDLLRRIAARTPKRDPETQLEVRWRYAVLLTRSGRREEAIAVADAVLACSPRHPGALSVRAMTLGALGRDAEALAAYGAMLAAEPQSAKTRMAIAALLGKQDRHDEALEVLRPLATGDHAMGRYTLADRCLQAGLWEEGWRHYESRIEAHRMFREVNVACAATGRILSRWTEGPPPPALMLIAEQGMGDILQFAGLIARLHLDAVQVRLFAPEALVSLLRRIDRRVEVVPKGAPFEARAGEAWSPLMSLPLRLQLAPEQLHVGGYLARETARRTSAQLKVGIAWQGNPQHLNDANRSAPLAAFAPLAERDDIRLVSLQQQAGTEQIAGCAFRDRLDLRAELQGPELAPFEVTAAIMDELDAVVCVDTALAHLAGALGKPVFVLLPKVGTDWRWMRDREECLWYRNARLCRQLAAGDWRAPMAQALSGLASLAAEARA